MTRGLPGDILHAAEQTIVQPFFAVELLFDSPNELYFWTGIGSFVHEGVTYVGTGNLMQISEVQESSDIAARGATIALSGIPSSLIGLALDEDYQGRTCKIKFGLVGSGFGADARLMVSDTEYLSTDGAGTRLNISHDGPVSMFDLFVGFMDQMQIDENPETCTIALTVENKLIDLQRPRTRRYTDNDHQSRFSGDVAFEFVTRLQNETFDWGPT